MYGGEMGALRVLVDDQVAWELSGNQGDQWLRAVVAERNPGYHLVSAHQKPNFRVIEPSAHPLFAFWIVNIQSNALFSPRWDWGPFYSGFRDPIFFREW